MTARVVSYRTAEGEKPAIVREGRTLLHVVVLGGGLGGQLSVQHIPRSEERYMRPLERRGRPYPLGRALRHFGRWARQRGASGEARELLAAVRREAA